jgi:uncharacterized protein YlxW (UPF0749 family)
MVANKSQLQLDRQNKLFKLVRELRKARGDKRNQLKEEISELQKQLKIK